MRRSDLLRGRVRAGLLVAALSASACQLLVTLEATPPPTPPVPSEPCGACSIFCARFCSQTSASFGLSARSSCAREIEESMIFGGGDYSMRVWLDPDKVAARGLTAGDVVKDRKSVV